MTTHLPLVVVVPLIGCVLALPACSAPTPNVGTSMVPASLSPIATLASSEMPTPSATSLSAPAQPLMGQAAEAPKAWVKQDNAEHWDRHSATGRGH